ncbi:hypothetical protein EVAR_7744_1 [Eumeta japonica]|uniref:Uncharacterized protein n=1 Tax=Eumeta variegata TaxID=151549 RepID=A0A4C1TMB2_EUMVA|nr:hypothetical protein EVAR_7744_1 [Eumeta japonica]
MSISRSGSFVLCGYTHNLTDAQELRRVNWYREMMQLWQSGQEMFAFEELSTNVNEPSLRKTRGKLTDCTVGHIQGVSWVVSWVTTKTLSVYHLLRYNQWAPLRRAAETCSNSMPLENSEIRQGAMLGSSATSKALVSERGYCFGVRRQLAV